MSQGSLNVPVTGPDPPSNFAGEINVALDAVVTQNSGASQPTNFPTTGTAPTAFQQWADTSPGGGIVDMREFDGSNWLRRGAQDQTAHVWMPIVGGGSGTIAAAATTDIGSVRQGYMTVTGAVPGTPITAFGSNALLTTGETKFLRFTAAGIITYNAASMILPGAADLSFNAGDTLQALYFGAGNWLCFDYRSNASAVGRNTGDVFEAWGTSARPGAVRALGLTIGNAASGATERANADTVNLFIFLYVNDTSLSVSGGRTAPGTTRANAITDYNLNKTITLPDLTLRATLAKTTQYLLSGVGATYTTPANTREIHARYIAGGGAGGSTTTAGGDGTATTFNGISANPGKGGEATFGAPGAGGTAGAGAATLRLPGSAGTAAQNGADAPVAGSPGAPGIFGMGAGHGTVNGNGGPGAANTGAGGAGGGGVNTGAGGGSGEYVELVITNPAASYIYTVGLGGVGSTSGNDGGDGGTGLIIVDEYRDFGLSHYLSL